MINQEIADKLFKIADLLEAQGASPFRVNAYRNAANMVDSLNRPVSEIVEQLEAALEEFRSVEEVLAVNGDAE